MNKITRKAHRAYEESITETIVFDDTAFGGLVKMVNCAKAVLERSSNE